MQRGLHRTCAWLKAILNTHKERTLIKSPTFLLRSITWKLISCQNSHSIMPKESEGEFVAVSKKLDKVYVQRNSERDTLTISFIYNADTRSKHFNLLRKATEPVSDALERLRVNLSKLDNPRKKLKIKDTPVSEAPRVLTVQLLLDGRPVDLTGTLNKDAWVDGAILKLNDKRYLVSTDDPQITSMKIPSCIMSGFLVMPSVDAQNCDTRTCIFSWYRKISSEERKELLSQEGFDQGKISTENCTYWLKLSDEMIYMPTQHDVGHYLKVTCSPYDGHKVGLELSAISKKPVEVGPGKIPLDDRISLTKYKLSEPNQFRLVTYNILANLYADSDTARNELFPHCPPYALQLDYRQPFLLKEISGYNADVVCLQEVDRKEFDRTYKPFFSHVSQMDSVFDTKGGQIGEGLATFYRRDKFELVHSHRTVLNELFVRKKTVDDPTAETQQQGLNEKSDMVNSNTSGTGQQVSGLVPHFILRDSDSLEAKQLLDHVKFISEPFSSNEQLAKRFFDRQTALQTTLLKFKDSNFFLLVGNTHLYFAPDADHIRLIQGSVCVKYLEFIKEYYRRTMIDAATPPGKESKIGLVFCGDMNSTPNCGLYKLATQGKVEEDLPDWRSNTEERVVGLTVESSLRFVSAYQDIEYTNYTPGFQGCLDYIYYEPENISCEKTIPLPRHEDVVATGGLPSEVFPSDHLALIADMRHSD